MMRAVTEKIPELSLAQVPFETRGESGRCLSHCVCERESGAGLHVNAIERSDM
jgi:hypothetical protein